MSCRTRLGGDFAGGDAGGDAGDVDQDVHAAEVLVDLPDGALDGGLVGHVAAVGDGPAAQGRDLADGGVAALGVEVDAGHVGPVAGQSHGRRLAQSARRPRDDGDLARQIKKAPCSFSHLFKAVLEKTESSRRPASYHIAAGRKMTLGGRGGQLSSANQLRCAIFCSRLSFAKRSQRPAEPRHPCP